MPDRSARIRLLILLLLTVAGAWAVQRGPLESAVHRAYRECRLCGLEDDEIAWMIESKADSLLSREEEIRLWASTFNETDTHQGLCQPCMQAILDAAGIE